MDGRYYPVNSSYCPCSKSHQMFCYELSFIVVDDVNVMCWLAYCKQF